MGDSIRVGRRSVSLSNQDKVLFPDDGITKADLLDYYMRVADAMLPLVKGRLLTMERFPDGIEDERFYQKSVSKYFPDWIDRKTVPKKGGTVTHVVVQEKATLAYLSNQAAITLHVSLATVEALDRPDQLIFDLDPSADDFDLVRRTALRIRELLEQELKLHTVVKTSGSKGLHVTVPLNGSATYAEVHAFANGVAEFLVDESPDELTLEHRKENRGDRIFVDWMRNSPAATAVAPYSVRARPGAPVAMPLSWEEVEDRKLDPQRYKMREAIAVVESGVDPWKGWRRRARSLTEPARRLERLRS